MKLWYDIKLWLKLYVIRSIIKRIGPKNNVEEVNYYRGRNFGYARIGDLAGDFVTARSITNDGITGLYPARGSNPPEEVVLNNAQIAVSEVSVYYRYRDLTIMASWYEWLLYGLIGGYKVVWAWTCVRQWWIGRQNVIREDRLEVLENLYENEVVKGNGATDPMRYFIERRGLAWMAHPNIDQMMRNYDLIFRSLEDAGDLKLDTGSRKYLLKPQALTTLARNASENRRHRDSVRMQWIIAFLTFGLFILAIPAAIEAVQGLIGYHEPPKLIPVSF